MMYYKIVMFPQPEVIEQLKKIFQPDKDHSYYHVIYGGIGSGKSTLVRKVAKEVGKGVIYINIEQDKSELFIIYFVNDNYFLTLISK